MIALPLTNFVDFWTAFLAIICSSVGVMNMLIGMKDNLVDLKFAQIEGYVPTRADNNTEPPANADKDQYDYTVKYRITANTSLQREVPIVKDTMLANASQTRELLLEIA